MNVNEFYYDLPEELIAGHPVEKRDESRLMVLNKKEKTIEHKIFKDILDYLNPGDCLVINNTNVIPARIYGNVGVAAHSYPTIEILLLKNISRQHMGNNDKTRKKMYKRKRINIWRWNFKTEQ